MARITIADLQEKLKQKDNTINTLLEQIHRQEKRYSNLISHQDYDTLQGQYRALQERYNILQGLYDKAIAKQHNARHAGRKPKVINTDKVMQLKASGLTVKQIAEQLKVSGRTVLRMLAKSKSKS